MAGESLVGRKHAEAILTDLVTPEQWEVCGGLIREAVRRRIGFALGGGLAFSAYTGNRRNTKDMDFYVLPRDQERLMALMAEHGFEEYTKVPYDPTWSYRGHRRGYIVDLLWRMLNNRSPVDDHWITRGWEVKLHGLPVKVIAPEELLWSKLYILRRERCDWPDIIGLLYAQSPVMDWEHLLSRLGADAPVLGSVLGLFRWLCPGRALHLPVDLWERTGLTPIAVPAAHQIDPERYALFGGGDWFSGLEGEACKSAL